MLLLLLERRSRASTMEVNTEGECIVWLASINLLSRVFFFLSFPFCYLLNARYSSAISNFILGLDSRIGVTLVASSISLTVKRNLSAPKQSTISKQRLICACTPCVNCIFPKNRRKKKTLCEFFYYYFCRKNDWLASKFNLFFGFEHNKGCSHNLLVRKYFKQTE